MSFTMQDTFTVQKERELRQYYQLRDTLIDEARGPCSCPLCQIVNEQIAQLEKELANAPQT
jgi:hypothetical protein